MICPAQFRARVGGFLPRAPRQRARIKTDRVTDKIDMTTTMTLASNLELGHTFHDSRIPSLSSWDWI